MSKKNRWRPQSESAAPALPRADAVAAPIGAPSDDVRPMSGHFVRHTYVDGEMRS
jgi:hypothetical protein